MKNVLHLLISKKPSSIPLEPDHNEYRKANLTKHRIKLILMGIAVFLLLVGIIIVIQHTLLNYYF